MIKITYFLLFVLFINTHQLNAKTINLHLWATPFEPKLFNKITHLFHQQNPNINVIATSYPSDDFKAALIQTILKDEAPDMILIPNDLLGYHQVLQLAKIPKDWLLDTTSKKLLNEIKINQQQFAIPIFTGNHLLLFYNRQLIDKPAKTWQEMYQQHLKLQAKSINTLGINISKMYYFIGFLNAYNGFPVKGSNIVINIDTTVKALKAYKRLITDNLVDIHCDYVCKNQQFFNGELAYNIDGLWAYQNNKRRLKENLAVALLPTLDGLKLKSMSGSHVLAFPNNSSQSEKASVIKKFAHFLQGDQIQTLLYQQLHMIPANQNTRRNLLTNNDDKVIFEQLSQTITMPVSTAMEALWDGMDVGVNLFLNDQLNAVQAAQFIKKQTARQLIRIKRLNNIEGKIH